MSAHFTTPTDEMLLLAETLGEVKTKADKLEAEFATQARPLEAATNALSAALSGIKALQFHVLDNNLGQLSARVEEMRKAVDEQVGVIALELKKADETNAAKAGQEAEALRSEIAALQAQLGTLGAQFSAQLERVEFSAKEEAKKLQLIPGPAGAAGASLNPRGTFVDGETYNRLDVVSWLGSSYIAAVDGVTEKPSKNSNQWQVLASRGGGAAGGAADFGSLAGVAQINQGGTGQTTRAAGLNALLPSQTGNVQYMLLTDGAGTVSWGAQPVAGLPSQTSNSGKLLTTDGTNASWSNAVTVSGNNATVTGTLTAGSGSHVFGNSANTAEIKAQRLTTDPSSVALQAVASHAIINFTGDTGYTWGRIGSAGNEILRIYHAGLTSITAVAGGGLAVGGGLNVSATTASTTTSSGALVVGNGTSGGLGVGGAANIGGTLTVANTSAQLVLGVDSGSALTYTIRPSQAGGAIQIVQDSATVNRWLSLGGVNNSLVYTESLRITNGGHVAVTNTTASTSTSSGALVVSGGVGVAGAIWAGDNVTVPNSKNFVVRNAAASSTAMRMYADSSDFGYIDCTANTELRLQVGSGTKLSITNTGNVTTTGNITTAAPSGGTAAAWKLGTVATVSPTSPNRTIEVDIGGTIYYIHAKTTNN